MADEIVFLHFDMRNEIIETQIKAYCVLTAREQSNDSLFVSIRRVTCQDFPTYAWV